MSPSPAAPSSGAPRRAEREEKFSQAEAAAISDPMTFERLIGAEPNPSPEEVKKEVNPFTEHDWRMWTYAWGGYVLRFCLIGGAIFSMLQYRANREETRVSRALDLVALWEAPQYQDAQKALSDRIDALAPQAAALLGPNPSPQKAALVMQSLGRLAMTDKGGTMPIAEFKDQFGKIVYFLNRLSFCVQGNLCSRDVSDAYFRDFASSFWQYFAGYVSDVRRNKPSFAKPIEDYVKEGGDATPAPQGAPSLAPAG